jgi:hypothetical protein
MITASSFPSARCLKALRERLENPFEGWSSSGIGDQYFGPCITERGPSLSQARKGLWDVAWCRGSTFRP